MQDFYMKFPKLYFESSDLKRWYNALFTGCKINLWCLWWVCMWRFSSKYPADVFI